MTSARVYVVNCDRHLEAAWDTAGHDLTRAVSRRETAVHVTTQNSCVTTENMVCDTLRKWCPPFATRTVAKVHSLGCFVTTGHSCAALLLVLGEYSVAICPLQTIYGRAFKPHSPALKAVSLASRCSRAMNSYHNLCCHLSSATEHTSYTAPLGNRLLRSGLNAKPPGPKCLISGDPARHDARVSVRGGADAATPAYLSVPCTCVPRPGYDVDHTNTVG